jgi:HNH endonuclease
METEDVAGKKVSVKGGGVCIYCGWDGGELGLHDEHVVPYSLGGNTVLLNASCSDCEGVTSYLDGYMANAIFGHLRIHIGLQFCLRRLNSPKDKGPSILRPKIILIF